MTYDFCLGCGVRLPQHVYECPICGFNNRFGDDQDISTDDAFLNDLSDEFNPDEESI